MSDDDRRIGLCEGCRHAREVRSGRGSEFLLCARSRDDDRFPKYPRLPVVHCDGYEPSATGAAAPEDAAP